MDLTGLRSSQGRKNMMMMAPNITTTPGNWEPNMGGTARSMA